MENPILTSKKDIITKCQVGELAKHLFKDFVIVWYDPEPNFEQFPIPLQNLCEMAQTFQTWETALVFLHETKKRCYVITTGDSEGEIFVRNIQAKENISDIYILSKDDNSQRAKNYQKISAVETQIENIFDKIEQKLLTWFNQESSLKLNLPKFAPVVGCPQNKLHRYLKVIPTNFENRDQAKNDFTALSREIFSDKKTQKAIADFEQSYNDFNKESILIAYTQESFLHKIMGGCLRIAPTADSIQYCRLPLKDLERAIKEQYQTKSKDFSGLLYKAAGLSAEQWSILKESVGQEIEMHGFLSVTKEKNFALKSMGTDFTKSVFITILVPKGPNEEEQGFAEVEELSESPQEKEVLFNVRSRFTVLEIEDILCRHVILLYGAQGFRKYMTEQNPVLQEVSIPDDSISCAHCKTLGAEVNGKMLFVNLENGQNYYCPMCLPNFTASNTAPFLCVPWINSPNNKIKIKGFATALKNKDSPQIPFYGYQCTKCNTKRQRFYLTCTDCNQHRWCENCFGNPPPDCFNQNHVILLETSPFSFWSQPMSKKELNSSSSSLKPQSSEIYRESREFQKAIEHYNLYIDQNENDKEKLAECYTNLAKVYFEQREYQQALECHFKALNIRKALHNEGDNHPDVATSYSNIGNVYLAQEEFNLALEYHSKALDIRRSLHGEDHPDVAASCQDVGVVYSKQAEYKKSTPEAAKSNSKLINDSKDEFSQALQYLFKSLDIRKSLLTEEDVIKSYNSIGNAYFAQEQYKEALEYFMKALETSHSIYVENHPVIADCYGNLARVYYKQENQKTALEYAMKSLNIRELVLEENHPDVAQAYNRAGLILIDKGEEKKAIEYFSKVLDIRKSLYGENHPDVAFSYNSLGMALNKKGDYAEAQVYYVKALGIRKFLYGEDHKDVGICYHHIGTAASNQRQYKEARDYYLKSLEIKKRNYGENHAVTAACYSSIGNSYKLQQDYQPALEYHLRALEIRKALYKDHQHIDLARSYNNLGEIYAKLRDFNQAIAYHLESLDIRKAINGENHPDVALAYTNIALVYEDQRDFKTALEYHENTLRIRRILHGENHREIATSYHNIGMLYEKQGDYQKALEYYTKYLAMRKIVDGEGHRRTERAQRIVDRVTKIVNTPQTFSFASMFSHMSRQNP